MYLRNYSRSNCQRTFANYETWTVKAIKKNLKKCKWDAARYALHLLADLLNCHVISLVALAVGLGWPGVVLEEGIGGGKFAGSDLGVFEQAHQEAS